MDERYIVMGSQRLVSGHAPCDCELLGGAAPVLFAEDAADVYPAFDASPAKALANVLTRKVLSAIVLVGMFAESSELSGCY